MIVGVDVKPGLGVDVGISVDVGMIVRLCVVVAIGMNAAGAQPDKIIAIKMIRENLFILSFVVSLQMP